MTREERKRHNRKWLAARIAAFVFCAAAFLILLIGIECLADAAVALTWNG